MARNNSTVSELYSSCRNNDINKVKELVSTLTLDEIDRIEPNGSTALHAASYYGHIEIVGLLLERGASRSIRNLHGYTPESESKGIEIRRLFLRENESERFVCHGDEIEWMKVDENVHREAGKWRWIIEHSWEGRNLDWLVHEVQTDFINIDFKESRHLERIKKYFDEVIDKKDPIYLITAYTAQTDFYSHLNKQLAIIGGNFKSANDNVNRCGMKCYLQILFTHCAFDRMSYIGECYRGMKITQHDLGQYEVRSHIMNKAFLSTSFDYSVAKKFAIKHSEVNKQKFTAICTYKIRNRRTALSIMEISEYRHEKEVLIMPYTAFQVKSIRRNSNNQNNEPDFFIDLEESAPTSGLNEQNQAINTEKQLTLRKKFMRKFNKWLGNES
ncbi:unnamed protein product [Rotaria sp. Silwood1]|nr:unnamed protein product [Rotaria sp. Silwood1]CAF1598072.1 unnamed protein product [Rotaria sp. Silwood1]CAF3822730.1 unnamed protein product [Rotaria sp. Silwood1]CAF4905427.1 unnamed protein product [Rotaria sp. Silwood1]